MKRPQEVKILDIKKFEQDIIENNNVSKEWERNKEREESLEHKPYCFNYIGDELNKAILYVNLNDDVYTISNAFPREKNSLDEDEYNALLNNFVKNNLSNIKHEISKSDVVLEDLVGKQISDKFYSFSSLANKSSCIAHPNDEKRWYAFVLDSLIKDKILPSKDIYYFLVEDGWTNENAEVLSFNYEKTYAVMEYTRKHLST